MAKTESTAVTRLIELAQQRSVTGDVDWFAPPKPKRIPREEVTQVVRVARRALRVSPGTVLGAFLAGMLTVIVTTLVLMPPGEDSPPPPAPAPVAALAAPIVVPIAAEPAPPAREPIPEVVAIAEPVAEPVAAPEPVVEPVAAPPPKPRAPRTQALKPNMSSRPVPKQPQVNGALAELQINSKPPCELYIDGRKIGWTPQRGVSVSPGRHVVHFRNREQGVSHKVIVDATASHVYKVIRDFTQP